MVIVCPHCGHRLKLRDAKPGNYKPTCSKCQNRFELKIPADSNAEGWRLARPGWIRRGSTSAPTKAW